MRRALALALALAAGTAMACSSKQAEPVGPGGGAGTGGEGSAIATPEPTAPAVVTDLAGAEAAEGKAAEVHGTARDAKLGAAVVASGLVVYCLGVESWPSEVHGSAVRASGRLEQTEELAAPDPTSAGTAGAVWVLRDCRYDR
jgi:hypothetical protein